MSLTVRPIAALGSDFEGFVELPYRLHCDLPNWVPPLRSDVKLLFDEKKNPFFEHATVQAFLAERANGASPRVVGRIAAIHNRLSNEFQGDRIGFFGFFECEDDPEAAAALFAAAEGWVAARGLDILRGPMNFSTNDDCGLLIEGFHRPPTILMPHNPPYYERLVEGSGFHKAKDLYAYLHRPPVIPEVMTRATERIQRRTGAVTRSMDMKRFEAEVELIREIYNSAWEKNWGFVPMTDREIDHMAKQLKPVVVPEFVRFAMVGGQAVGFALALPDLNQALIRLKGRLGPWGVVKLLWLARGIRQARVLTLGLKEGFRGVGLDVLLYHDLAQEGQKKHFESGEYSWMLEDNVAILRPLERMGAVRDKTYRVYDRPARGTGS